MDNKIKMIAYYGLGIALYVVLGMAMKIPLISHIGLDLGYVAFGCYLYLFGAPAAIIGIIGCMIESLLVSGWIPIGWMAGQCAIGVICGYIYHHNKNIAINIIITILAVILGVGIIKTGIECYLYNIPIAVKIIKNLVAVGPDSITMILGYLIGIRIKDINRG